ncbi:YiaA/YiaB family inner membrane protein [Leptospira meyeri]|nr:YiaA/YiaB family inner membrane protein [Leptospira meyeri]MCW7488512.1 hypothetical protein [Leptospira meyeri]
MFTFIVGIWNADMMLNEKGFYITILMYGLFSAVYLPLLLFKKTFVIYEWQKEISNQNFHQKTKHN